MGKQDPPKYDPGKDLASATQTYLKYLPQITEAERAMRAKYDFGDIQHQQQLQAQAGTAQYSQQLAALHQLDPQSGPMRYALAANIFRDLQSGYNVPQDLLTAGQSDIRGAQAARGNVLGNAPVASEALYTGDIRNKLYMQHLAAAQGFLQGPTPEQQLLAVQPVSPPSANRFVNPAAPGQMAQNAYQNYLAQYQAAGGGQGGAQLGQGIGATLGGIVGGIYGGVGGSQLGVSTGGAVGGAVGGYFSDVKLKNHIEYMGRSPSGLPIFRFNYDDVKGRYEGTIAQEIMSIRPDAVERDKNGYWRVLYDKIDIEFKQLAEG